MSLHRTTIITYSPEPPKVKLCDIHGLWYLNTRKGCVMCGRA